MNEVTATIGGVELRFHPRRGAVRELLAKRFGDFLCRAHGSRNGIDVDLQLDDGAPTQAADETLELDELPSGDLIISGRDLRAEVASDNRSAKLCGPLVPRSLDAVVRLLLARALLNDGALLVHASAVVLPSGRGVTFVGPSGSGKTTIAETLPGIVAGDEAVIVSEKSGTAIVTGTPYWHGQPISAPLDSMLFISRGDPSSWRDVSPSLATAKLFAACGPLPPSASARALAASAHLVGRIPRRAEVALATKDEIRRWLAPRIGMTLVT